MTLTPRQQFILDWRHEIEGWVLDAAMSGRQGSELSLFLRSIRARIESKLGLMYDHLKPDKPLPVVVNGQPVKERT